MRRARRGLVMALVVLAALALSADDAHAWRRRRRGFRSSRPPTAAEVCCLLPVVLVIVVFGGVSRAHRRGQGFTSMGRHRRW